ncbi:acyltransferase family protein [Leucobacter luti]|uniref:Peptidoglycan/LPS O-acetylase OafA/YrhL n=1 Tax=Leucobacter luti TaxID=340320 RepID=A0A4Q7TQ93_9MICO|nr:acyltransferase family protein [Leucobacter luti]MBL3699747.1 acyltransferase [Leucobacter luti]RZT62931.1 peptidoglycan/LPS O-acetylase OafA/YrhL [Leucobacter luti]
MSETVKLDVPRAAPTPHSRIRLDIQGLRAVAVGVVLLFHANAPFLPGGFIGVDVFFVISGFLITGILIREASATGRVNLAGFYAKRVRRILPAATLVLLATAVLSVLFLPAIRWQSIGGEIIAAAVYLVNLVFAANTNYLNAEVAASPIQHFWTLAVEEQFYIVWPLLIIVMLYLGRRFLARLGRARQLQILLPAGVLLLFVPSLAWSAVYTATDPAPAYFATTTRLWELAVGAMVAVFATQLARIPDRVGFCLGWAGLLGIVVGSVVYTAATPFPGVAALLPTLSAAAIIVGGMAGRGERGAGALLSLRPVRWVGDISYSLYLWHWPLVVVATYLLGGSLRFREGLLVIALSFLPAWLSYRFVENPFRDWKRLQESAGSALRAGAALVGVSALIGAALMLAPTVTQGNQLPPGGALGAMALVSDPAAGDPAAPVVGGFTPTAVDARNDNPVVYASGCHADQGFTEHPGCTLGNADAETTLALVGDSHAASWVPALQEIAAKNDLRLRVYTKSACGFADVATVAGGDARYDACSDWNERVMEQLIAEQPDLVLTTNSVERKVWDDGPLTMSESVQPFSDGLRRSWESLNAAGIPVTVIRDVPRMDIDVPECVSANPGNLAECAVARATAVDAQATPEINAQRGLSETGLVDLTNWICPAEACAPVIGNVLVWRDGHHLTATYSATLATPLEDALRENTVSRELFTER